MNKPVLVMFAMLIWPWSGFADDLADLKAKLAELEAKLKALENVQPDEMGLAVKDFSGKQAAVVDASGELTESVTSQLTPQQIQQIRKTLIDFQQKQAQSNEALEWINEYFGINKDP